MGTAAPRPCAPLLVCTHHPRLQGCESWNRFPRRSERDWPGREEGETSPWASVGERAEPAVTSGHAAKIPDETFHGLLGEKQPFTLRVTPSELPATSPPPNSCCPVSSQKPGPRGLREPTVQPICRLSSRPLGDLAWPMSSAQVRVLGEPSAQCPAGLLSCTQSPTTSLTPVVAHSLHSDQLPSQQAPFHSTILVLTAALWFSPRQGRAPSVALQSPQNLPLLDASPTCMLHVHLSQGITCAPRMGYIRINVSCVCSQGKFSKVSF